MVFPADSLHNCSPSRLRKNSVFRRKVAESRLAANYASVESESYTQHLTAISDPLLETGVFPQPASSLWCNPRFSENDGTGGWRVCELNLGGTEAM